MCIVTIKPIGIDLPKIDILENCFVNNPDGCGYMFVRNGKVKIRKGFLEFKEFYSDYQKQKLNKNDLIVFHFRIATSGDIDKFNTHPFPISNDVNELIKTENDCEIAIAHNGILSSKGSTIDKYKISDTMDFILEILSDKNIYENIESKSILALIENRIVGSRIVVLKKDRTFLLLGNGWKEKDGLIHSNDGWKRKKVFNLSDSKTQYPIYSYDDLSYDDPSDDYLYASNGIDCIDKIDNEEWKEEKEIVCPCCENDMTIYNISDFHDVYECDLCLSIFVEDEIIYPIEKHFQL